jgi:hypothetical protein
MQEGAPGQQAQAREEEGNKDEDKLLTHNYLKIVYINVYFTLCCLICRSTLLPDD